MERPWGDFIKENCSNQWMPLYFIFLLSLGNLLGVTAMAKLLQETWSVPSLQVQETTLLVPVGTLTGGVSEQVRVADDGLQVGPVQLSVSSGCPGVTKTSNGAGTLEHTSGSAESMKHGCKPKFIFGNYERVLKNMTEGWVRLKSHGKKIDMYLPSLVHDTV